MSAPIDTMSLGNCKCSNEGNEALPNPALRWETGSPKERDEREKNLLLVGVCT